MRPRRVASLGLVTFLLGALIGFASGKREEIAPSTYAGVPPAEAAKALLQVAEAQAGTGTYERIHVARVYLLGGMRDDGQKLLDAVLQGAEVEDGDWIRAGRVYAEAGEWDKAREAFEKVLALAPKDEDWLAEIGAYYNLNGDRKTAEGLFERSFAQKPLLKNVLAAAGSYVGVAPRQR